VAHFIVPNMNALRLLALRPLQEKFQAKLM
jgi:hypothetical protein